MEAIYPHQPVIHIDKLTGAVTHGNLIASRVYPLLVKNQRGEMVRAKQFKIRPIDGSPEFWTDPLPMAPEYSTAQSVN